MTAAWVEPTPKQSAGSLGDSARSVPSIFGRSGILALRPCPGLRFSFHLGLRPDCRASGSVARELAILAPRTSARVAEVVANTWYSDNGGRASLLDNWYDIVNGRAVRARSSSQS